MFGQPHYWAVDLGRVLCLGLSSVRFRSNKDSVHEVFIDQEQLRWFEEQLANSEGRPVFVFTHAPPMGCGLKVVEVSFRISQALAQVRTCVKEKPTMYTALKCS